MKRLVILLSLGALAGCWTFDSTIYPDAHTSAAPSGEITVSVQGFEATVAEYIAVSGFRTFYVPGHCGRYHYHPGSFETVPTHDWIMQARPTDVFRTRAKDSFEEAGFVVGAATPDWTVDVVFAGPGRTAADAWRETAWMLFTLFFCDYEAQSWTAKLRVRDNRTGRLVFHQTYEQRYETHVFGLIPLFSPGACEEASPAYAQTWCLSALTDRAVADASAYLLTQQKGNNK